MDMRSEREDLKTAAEQSLNVILDLGLDGIIRWVSPSWKDVVGTTVESVKNKPIADILLSDRDGFANAIQSMKEDDSKSRVIRFQVQKGPFSVLKRNIETDEGTSDREKAEGDVEDVEDDEHVLNLEGQGIMVYDRSSDGEGHVSSSRKILVSESKLIQTRQCGCCAPLTHREKSPSTSLNFLSSHSVWELRSWPITSQAWRNQARTILRTTPLLFLFYAGSANVK